MKTKFFILVLVTVLVATTLGFAPSGISYSPPIDDRVGGIDFDQYCRSIGATHHGIDTSKGRDGVYCQFDSGGKIQWLTKSDIDIACRNQYGNSAYADHDGSNHPYAWYCAGPSQSNSGSNSQSGNNSSNQSSNQNSNQGQNQGSSSSSSANSGNNITTAACSGYTKDFLSGNSYLPSGKYLTTGYDKVLLRSSPDQSKCTYGWLNKGQYYPVLGQSGGWYKTRAGGITGWVMAAYVSTGQGSSSSSSSQPQANPSPAPAPKSVECFKGMGIGHEPDGKGGVHHYVWFMVGEQNVNSWKVSGPGWKPGLWTGNNSGIAEAGFGWPDWLAHPSASEFWLCPPNK